MDNLNGNNINNQNVVNPGLQSTGVQGVDMQNLLDTTADDLEMQQLDKEFATQLQETDKQLAMLKETSQKLEAAYDRQLKIAKMYCDDMSKLIEKYNAIEAKKTAKFRI